MQEVTTRSRRLTWVLAGRALTVLVAASPGALRDAWEHGGICLFSWEFVEDQASPSLRQDIAVIGGGLGS